MCSWEVGRKPLRPRQGQTREDRRRNESSIVADRGGSGRQLDEDLLAACVNRDAESFAIRLVALTSLRTKDSAAGAHSMEAKESHGGSVDALTADCALATP